MYTHVYIYIYIYIHTLQHESKLISLYFVTETHPHLKRDTGELVHDMPAMSSWRVGMGTVDNGFSLVEASAVPITTLSGVGVVEIKQQKRL